MRIVLLADLHGNAPATRAMAAAIDKLNADEIWFLGDAVGKGPSSVFCCDWVREHCTVCVGGNWDYGIGGQQYGEDTYFWDQLGPERMNWLNTLPLETTLTISGRHFRVFHGRPVHEFIRPDDGEEKMELAFTDENGKVYDGVLFADVHRPFIRSLHAGYIVNTGSVGNSLGVTMAHALVIDGEKDSEEYGPLLMSILSVPYDHEQAVADCDAELPHREEYITEVTTGYYART